MHVAYNDEDKRISTNELSGLRLVHRHSWKLDKSYPRWRRSTSESCHPHGPGNTRQCGISEKSYPEEYVECATCKQNM